MKMREIIKGIFCVIIGILIMGSTIYFPSQETLMDCFDSKGNVIGRLKCHAPNQENSEFLSIIVIPIFLIGLIVMLLGIVILFQRIYRENDYK